MLKSIKRKGPISTLFSTSGAGAASARRRAHIVTSGNFRLLQSMNLEPSPIECDFARDTVRDGREHD